MTPPRVLVVEDEFLIRLTLAEALQDDGFEVVEASSGDEALELIADASRFALLMTDVQLPGKLDGVALARAVRERAPELPVIFMTGRPDTMRSPGGTGRDVYISKPYLPSQVCAAARRLTGI